MIKRFVAPVLVILVCLALGSCASVSGFVSDTWPTWAGGMPRDIPPRPGAPGYEEFLIHQQGKDTTAAVPAANANEQVGAPAGYPRGDQSAVQGGGLY